MSINGNGNKMNKSKYKYKKLQGIHYHKHIHFAGRHRPRRSRNRSRNRSRSTIQRSLPRAPHSNGTINPNATTTPGSSQYIPIPIVHQMLYQQRQISQQNMAFLMIQRDAMWMHRIHAIQNPLPPIIPFNPTQNPAPINPAAITYLIPSANTHPSPNGNLAVNVHDAQQQQANIQIVDDDDEKVIEQPSQQE